MLVPILNLNFFTTKKSIFLKTITLMVILGLEMSSNTVMAKVFDGHPYGGLTKNEQVNLYYSAANGYVGPDIERNWDLINARDKADEERLNKMLKMFNKNFLMHHYNNKFTYSY